MIGGPGGAGWACGAQGLLEAGAAIDNRTEEGTADRMTGIQMPRTMPMLVAIIGDPTVAGWVIFSAYLAVAIACAAALRVALIGAAMAAVYPGVERRARDRSAAYKASFLFWALLIVLFIFLGINKQIDMQTWVTVVGRRIAKAQGWYDQRAQVQTIFVLAIAVSGLAILTVLLKLTRDLLPRHVLAFFGLTLLVVFLLARAPSFHAVDAALGLQLFGIRLSWVLELAGIICVGLCAVKSCWWYIPYMEITSRRRHRTTQQSPPPRERHRDDDLRRQGAHPVQQR